MRFHLRISRFSCKIKKNHSVSLFRLSVSVSVRVCISLSLCFFVFLFLSVCLSLRLDKEHLKRGLFFFDPLSLSLSVDYRSLSAYLSN